MATAAAAPPPTASAPRRSSACWSATRRCTAASASSRTGPSSRPRRWSPGCSRLLRAAIFSLGTRVDVSVRARLFTRDEAGHRAAGPDLHPPLLLRAAETCEADHVEPYAEGGPTTQENGRLLCGFHNRLRNQRERGSGHHPSPPEAGAQEGPRTAARRGSSKADRSGAPVPSPGLPRFQLDWRGAPRGPCLGLRDDPAGHVRGPGSRSHRPLGPPLRRPRPGRGARRRRRAGRPDALRRLRARLRP